MTRLLTRVWDLGLSLCALQDRGSVICYMCYYGRYSRESKEQSGKATIKVRPTAGKAVTYESGERFTRAKACSRGEQRQVSDSHISEANCKLLQETRDKSFFSLPKRQVLRGKNLEE